VLVTRSDARVAGKRYVVVRPVEAGAQLVHGARDLERTPCLIDAQVAHQIGSADGSVIAKPGAGRIADVAGARAGGRPRERTDREKVFCSIAAIPDGVTARPGILDRQRGADAVAV